MRNIMHVYLDPKCIEILQNIKTAMTEDSVILIDDMVLSNQSSHWLAASLDLVMMSCLGLWKGWRSSDRISLVQRVSRSGRFLPTRTNREIGSSLLRPNEGLRFFDPSISVLG